MHPTTSTPPVTSAGSPDRPLIAMMTVTITTMIGPLLRTRDCSSTR